MMGGGLSGVFRRLSGGGTGRKACREVNLEEEKVCDALGLAQGQVLNVYRSDPGLIRMLVKRSNLSTIPWLPVFDCHLVCIRKLIVR